MRLWQQGWPAVHPGKAAAGAGEPHEWRTGDDVFAVAEEEEELGRRANRSESEGKRREDGRRWSEDQGESEKERSENKGGEDENGSGRGCMSFLEEEGEEELLRKAWVPPRAAQEGNADSCRQLAPRQLSAEQPTRRTKPHQSGAGTTRAVKKRPGQQSCEESRGEGKIADSQQSEGARVKKIGSGRAATGVPAATQKMGRGTKGPLARKEERSAPRQGTGKGVAGHELRGEDPEGDHRLEYSSSDDEDSEGFHRTWLKQPAVGNSSGAPGADLGVATGASLRPKDGPGGASDPLKGKGPPGRGKGSAGGKRMAAEDTCHIL